MILTVNYEEIQALRAGARAVLGSGPGPAVAVAAPPEDRARVEALPPLVGDISARTLAEEIPRLSASASPTDITSSILRCSSRTVPHTTT